MQMSYERGQKLFEWIAYFYSEEEDGEEQEHCNPKTQTAKCDSSFFHKANGRENNARSAMNTKSQLE